MGNNPSRNDPTAISSTPGNVLAVAPSADQDSDDSKPPLPHAATRSFVGGGSRSPRPVLLASPPLVASSSPELPVFLSIPHDNSLLSSAASTPTHSSFEAKPRLLPVMLRSAALPAPRPIPSLKPSLSASTFRSTPDSPPIISPAATHYGIDLNDIIERLVALGSSKCSPRDPVPVLDREIKTIVQRSRHIFMDQPILLRLSPPVKIVGDIHGQFFDLVRIFNSCGYPPSANYLFLGDYVDRGHKSLETLLLLLCFKLKYPENFFMLRGNHELANLTKIYGFYDECKRRLPRHGVQLWKLFVDVFNVLPVAAIVAEKIFCVHGGLSPCLFDLKQVTALKRPSDVPDKGLLADLLWLDPDPTVRDFHATKWPKNDRGVSVRFGKRHLDHFCQRFGMDLVVRGHMVVEDGYEFFHKRKLVTVFLAPNYCGEFNNFGAVMSVSRLLECSFELIRPR